MIDFEPLINFIVAWLDQNCVKMKVMKQKKLKTVLFLPVAHILSVWHHRPKLQSCAPHICTANNNPTKMHTNLMQQQTMNYSTTYTLTGSKSATRDIDNTSLASGLTASPKRTHIPFQESLRNTSTLGKIYIFCVFTHTCSLLSLAIIAISQHFISSTYGYLSIFISVSFLFFSIQGITKENNIQLAFIYTQTLCKL